MKLPLILATSALFLTGVTAHAETTSEKASALEGNPFGIASGAEWAGDYARFEPLLHEAGIGWLRYFREWDHLQPKQGEWDWKWADDFVAAAKANHIQITAPLAYFAPWASSGNDGRTFPVKDMQYWRDFVAGVVTRYHQDIQYWEMWNEPQSFQKNGTPKLYADMVSAAYDTAKKIDPQAKIGLTTASLATSYLNMVLKAGAADHFDYLCVHPYENIEQLTRTGGEVYFLSMAGNLRRLLAAYHQKADLPLWITEIGWQAPIKPDAEKDAQQAQLMIKTYILSLAQGFQRVCWFEARGPAYGKGTDHGVLRPDWTPRPVLAAMKTMTTALGEAPKAAGWLDWSGSYAFLFEHRKGATLVAWAPVGQEQKVKFTGAVSITDLTGQETKLAAGEELKLTNTPVFITGVPDELVKSAKAHAGQPFPWGGDYTAAQEVKCTWGGQPVQAGLEPYGKLTLETVGNESFLRVKKGGWVNFRANPGFAPFGTTDLEIKIVARRAAANQVAGFQLMYETLKTIHGYERAGWWTIPAEDGWQEFTWHLKDANFVGHWAYNLGITETNGDLLIKEVSVRKAAK